MNQGTFKKVGQSEQPQYGPRAVLVCGFASNEQEIFLKLLKKIQLTDVPVIFSSTADGEKRLGDLLLQPHQSGREADAGNVRAVILSGISENELHRTLSAYRQVNLPRPLWATLTPTSENWTLSALLQELQQEKEAIENRRK